VIHPYPSLSRSIREGKLFQRAFQWQRGELEILHYHHNRTKKILRYHSLYHTMALFKATTDMTRTKNS
jgi:hypothetical protein